MSRFEQIWHARRHVPFDTGVRGAIKSYGRRLIIPCIIGILSFGAIVLVLKTGSVGSAIVTGGIVLLILGWFGRLVSPSLSMSPLDIVAAITILTCTSAAIILAFNEDKVAAGVFGAISIVSMISIIRDSFGG